MRSLVLSFASGAAAAAIAAPEPVAVPNLEARAGSAITNFAQLNSSIAAASSAGANGFANAWSSIYSAIQPSATPTSDAQIQGTLSQLSAQYSGNPLAAGAALLLSGMTAESSIGNPIADVMDFGACNSFNNTNPPPKSTIYPKAGPNDAPYDVMETYLRQAIYIPPGFTYGQKPPVIFLPGTGVYACENFAPNIGKLISQTPYGDPVYLNIPDNMLNDEQTNAEYTAYAVNYISSITGGNVSVISWSAGAPVATWAFKYWPSTRSHVTNDVAISGDYHGTLLAPLICPPGFPCEPAVLQQFYNAEWIQTLRSNNGDDAHVPTTSIFNVFDEIVEPQVEPIESAFIGNANGVPTANYQIQNFCPPGTLAGGPNFGHENALYNPVAYALVLDALKSGTVANSQRAGPYNCSQLMATGLSYSDVFATEALIPLAGFNIVTYTPKVETEPPIKPYAASG